MDSKLQGLLKQYSAYFSIEEGSGKVRCDINGHCFPPRFDSVAAFVHGSKFPKLQKRFDAERSLNQFEPLISQSKNFPIMLYCSLTGQLLDKSLLAVKKHMQGKKYTYNKERHDKGEFELKPEPNIEDIMQELSVDDGEDEDEDEDGEDEAVQAAGVNPKQQQKQAKGRGGKEKAEEMDAGESEEEQAEEEGEEEDDDDDDDDELMDSDDDGFSFSDIDSDAEMAGKSKGTQPAAQGTRKTAASGKDGNGKKKALKSGTAAAGAAAAASGKDRAAANGNGAKRALKGGAAVAGGGGPAAGGNAKKGMKAAPAPAGPVGGGGGSKGGLGSSKPKAAAPTGKAGARVSLQAEPEEGEGAHLSGKKNVNKPSKAKKQRL